MDTRCAITGNPVGTDARPVGQSCECPACQEWQREHPEKGLMERVASELEIYDLINRWLDQID